MDWVINGDIGGFGVIKKKFIRLRIGISRDIEDIRLIIYSFLYIP